MDSKSYIPQDPQANPAGTDGFEFVEFAADDPHQLESLFSSLGLTKYAQHKTRDVSLWRQGQINFIINAEPNSHAAQFVSKHGPSATAMGFRVKDAAKAKKHVLAAGAKAVVENKNSWVAADIPVIYGIGESLLYLIDQYDDNSIYSDFTVLNPNSDENSVGLTYIDHLTHNVFQGNMDKWAEFYIKLFNFRQIRYFDISGKQTGLVSRAMSSPCNKIRIPLNESSDDKSQIAEYLEAYHGEGIQHIALGTTDIYDSIEQMRANGRKFMKVPDTYFRLLDTRFPDHGEPLERMRKNKILMDGEAVKDNKWELLLQIFTTTVIGPIFFEIIQRKGNEGFGEGNFQALFDSIELDQIERGVL